MLSTNILRQMAPPYLCKRNSVFFLQVTAFKSSHTLEKTKQNTRLCVVMQASHAHSADLDMM